MSMKIAFALVGVAIAVAGCKPTQKDYPLSVAEALRRLDNADIIGFRNARQCGLLIHFVKTLPENQSLTWFVQSAGQEMASFTIALHPTATGTQATITVPKSGQGGELYDGKQQYSHPAMMQPLRPALQELVDSAMVQRPYDFRRIRDPINIAPPNTLQNCSIGQQTLARGVPMSLDDPEGVPHDDAVRLGLIR